MRLLLCCYSQQSVIQHWSDNILMLQFMRNHIVCGRREKSTYKKGDKSGSWARLFFDYFFPHIFGLNSSLNLVSSSKFCDTKWPLSVPTKKPKVGCFTPKKGRLDIMASHVTMKWACKPRVDMLRSTKFLTPGNCTIHPLLGCWAIQHKFKAWLA